MTYVSTSPAISSKPILIGLTGAAGVGKSFVAENLRVNFDFRRVSFGGGIKAATAGILRYAGVSHDETEMIANHDKDFPIDVLSQLTSREVQIAIGQGIRAIAPDFWCNIAGRNIDTWMRCRRSVVVDDIRQANEVQTIRSLGGVVVKLLPGPASRLTGAPDLDGMDTLPHDITVKLGAPGNTMGQEGREILSAVMRYRYGY